MDKKNHDSRIDDAWHDDDDVLFEKIARHRRVPLPVSSTTPLARSSKETAASKKIRRKISQKGGGMHRRRRKKIL